METQFVFDVLIVFSFFMMIFVFRAEIIMYVLDVDFDDGSIGNSSYEERNLKWKIRIVHILMYFTLTKIKQESIPFEFQLF